MNGLYFQYEEPWKVQYEKMGRRCMYDVLYIADRNHQRS